VSAVTVICTWQGDDRELALRVVRAAAAQGPAVVVDMSPGDDLVAATANIDGVDALHEPGSSGLGESRAIGYARADARHVAFLDSDALPREGWLDALSAAVSEPGVAIAGGPVVPVWPAGVRRPWLFGTASAGDFLSMLDLGPSAMDVPRVLPGNMIVDRESVGSGPFDPSLGRRAGRLVGAEEIAMMLRAVERGERVRYVPGAIVDHHTRADRMSWRWMWRRVHAAGRESALTAARLEPMPRRLTLGDHAFRLVSAPAFLAGRRAAR
jgi:mycofactocin glycosyltransferase